VILLRAWYKYNNKHL